MLPAKTLLSIDSVEMPRKHSTSAILERIDHVDVGTADDDDDDDDDDDADADADADVDPNSIFFGTVIDCNA